MADLGDMGTRLTRQNETLNEHISGTAGPKLINKEPKRSGEDKERE